MKVTLDIKKSLEENASDYFDKAKKAKKKIKGAKEAIARARKELKRLQKKEKIEVEKQKEITKVVKREWYEKFRWFYSSENFLVLGGRDATSNEVLIKKHTDPHDIVLHTDMVGSPFFVIKTEGKKPIATLKEAADATTTFSKAWKLGLQTSDVFYVNPDQVSKKARPGEYMGKGAFMIYGKTNYINNKVNLAIGLYKDKIMSGPEEAVKKHCKKYLILIQGSEKVSQIAKKIQHKLGGSLDDIIRALPAGEFKIQIFK